MAKFEEKRDNRGFNKPDGRRTDRRFENKRYDDKKFEHKKFEAKKPEPKRPVNDDAEDFGFDMPSKSFGDRDASAVVEGRNAVFELLRSGRAIEKLYIAKDMNKDIAEKARAMRIQVSELDKRKLEAMSEGGNAQGVIALCSPIEYVEIEDMIALAEERGEKPFIIICDGLNSPHNLGAIIRTAECAGVHGVVIPLHRSIGITPTVTRVSEGAVNHMLISKATNIRNVIEDLKEKGVWTACADMDGDSYTATDLNIPLALVVGGEDKGITPLIKKTCDMVLAIPQKGHLNSLNASVAAAVLMYEVVRQRG